VPVACYVPFLLDEAATETCAECDMTFTADVTYSKAARYQ